MANLITPEFRVSYPQVFTAKKNDLNGKDEFSVMALFPKDADLTQLKAAVKDAVVKQWGADQAKWPRDVKTGEIRIRLPFRDQSEKAKFVDGKKVLPAPYEEGCVFLTLRSQQKPGLIDQAKKDITDSVQFYAGCWARASVNVKAYDQKGNAGVAIYLGNLQKVRDGESLGGRTRAEDDFAPIEGAAGPGGAAAGSAADLFG